MIQQDRNGVSDKDNPYPENAMWVSSSLDVDRSLVDGGTYKIIVGGHLDEQWEDWFYSMKISHVADGYTVLTGYLVDQSSLHGILSLIRDLNLILVSLYRLEMNVEMQE